MGSTKKRDKAHAAAVDQAAEVSWLRAGDSFLTIEINARPGSRRRGFLRSLPTGPVVGLLSAPEKGRANRELIEFIAEFLAVPVAAVSIIRGHGSRQKVVRVETSATPTLVARLRKLIDQA